MLPQSPKEPLAFANAVVNVSIAHLQLDISVNQENIFRDIMKTADNESEAFQAISYGETLFVPVLLYPLYLTTELAVQASEYAQNQSQAYSANTNLFSKYKQEFGTVDAWENEKVTIRQKRANEETFLKVLKEKEAIKNRELTEVHDEVQETSDRVHLKMVELLESETAVTESITST